MLRRGSPPYLECSTKGDTRFSPFFARLKGDKLSIEDYYQGAKIFENGDTGLNWREAKGRKCINPEYVKELYAWLWEEYIRENPELHSVLTESTGLSDIFGQEGGTCQADTLWKIREKLINGTF